MELASCVTTEISPLYKYMFIDLILLFLAYNSYACQGARKTDLAFLYLICMCAHVSYFAYVLIMRTQVLFIRHQSFMRMHVHMHTCKIQNILCHVLATHMLGQV